MMNLTRKQKICIVLLFILFLILNSSFFWKAMYPIAYQDEVRKASYYFEVDPFLVLAIVQNESKFVHEGLSQKGARGLMQLMPETAEWANQESGLETDPNNYIKDPNDNILLGTWYISYLLEKYKGNYVKAVVAYNAGEGRVDRWLENRIWDGTEEHVYQIPIGETRHYLSRVLYYYNRYQEIYEGDF